MSRTDKTMRILGSSRCEQKITSAFYRCATPPSNQLFFCNHVGLVSLVGLQLVWRDIVGYISTDCLYLCVIYVFVLFCYSLCHSVFIFVLFCLCLCDILSLFPCYSVFIPVLFCLFFCVSLSLLLCLYVSVFVSLFLCLSF